MRRLKGRGRLRRFANAGIATLVQARSNSDARSRDAIVERVGESSNRKPPDISMHNVPKFGQESQELNGLVDGLLELSAKPRPLRLVPFERVSNVSLRAQPEGRAPRHPFLLLRLALTSSQAMSASSEGSASRRSSSSRCQSGIGTSAPARLSRISSSNRRRSAGGSRRISSRSAAAVLGSTSPPRQPTTTDQNYT